MKTVGEEAFQLGLLMGTESYPKEEEQTTVFSFHHFLVQQFTAAKYVVTLDKVSFYDFVKDSLLFVKFELRHHEITEFFKGKNLVQERTSARL